MTQIPRWWWALLVGAVIGYFGYGAFRQWGATEAQHWRADARPETLDDGQRVWQRTDPYIRLVGASANVQNLRQLVAMRARVERLVLENPDLDSLPAELAALPLLAELEVESAQHIAPELAAAPALRRFKLKRYHQEAPFPFGLLAAPKLEYLEVESHQITPESLPFGWCYEAKARGKYPHRLAMRDASNTDNELILGEIARFEKWVDWLGYERPQFEILSHRVGELRGLRAISVRASGRLRYLGAGLRALKNLELVELWQLDGLAAESLHSIPVERLARVDLRGLKLYINGLQSFLIRESGFPKIADCMATHCRDRDNLRFIACGDYIGFLRCVRQHYPHRLDAPSRWLLSIADLPQKPVVEIRLEHPEQVQPRFVY